jgi:N-acetylmuramoyl-L-alanine amidase
LTIKGNLVDLAAPAVFTASRIGNPSRLVIELREAPSAPAVPVVEAAAPAAVKPAEAPAEPGTPGAAPAITRKSAPEQVAKTAPPALAFPRKPVPEPAAAAPISGPISDKPLLQTAPAIAAAVPPVLAVPVKPLTTTPPPEPLASAKPVPSASAALAETGAAATRKSDGKNSLIRALGLKINRVVIDPGHGGHDQGTMGKRGLIEKELVLDVGKRLGALIEQQLGCEVVYTRGDDTFVPLEGRTALANEKKADLFISLHANSSSYARIAGVETFFLNFTTARDALDVAARENASSQKSISELQDLLQRIARQEKIEESKELAGRIQTAMFTFSSRYNPGMRNRGVKRAPFVVLVGAQMPSVLVEIGFLSNSREETLLKRPDHRQRVAEALLKGVSRYTQSLSHFQVAQAGQ